MRLLKKKDSQSAFQNNDINILIRMPYEYFLTFICSAQIVVHNCITFSLQ